MPTNSSIFLDTSILIALAVHSPDTKARIKKQLRQPSTAIVTSAIVRQEYKRRLLKEAAYLLGTLNKLGSVQKLRRHLELLPPQQGRKRNICIDTLNTVFDESSPEESTERLRRYLRTMLTCGLDVFSENVDEVLEESGCAQSYEKIIEKQPYHKYDFGKLKCAASCGASEFCSKAKDTFKRIGEYLSAQQCNRQQWIDACSAVVEGTASNAGLKPCEKLGDLFIAVESRDASSFYTMNGSDSQFLCKPLGQSMILRKKNPIHPDVTYQAGTDWDLT